MSVCRRAEPCLKFSVALAPPSAVLRLASPRPLGPSWRVPTVSSVTYAYLAGWSALLLRTGSSRPLGGLVRVYVYAVVRTLVLFIYHPIVSSLLLSFLFLYLRLPLRPAGAIASAQEQSCNDSLSLQIITGRRDRGALTLERHGGDLLTSARR